jgi:hypothetical protein
MDIFETLLTVFVILIFFSIPFAVFAFARYLRYKETIALAERGLLRPERKRSGRDTLRWGIVITMVGLGLLCGLWPLGFMTSSVHVTGEGPAPETVDGEGVIAEGPAPNPAIGESDVSPLPFGIGPWMVLGSLPFFFGLSLIIIYWVNKREDAEEAIPPNKEGALGKEEER